VIISLNPDWRIRSDDLRWIVERLHVRKQGEPDEYAEWRVWGYFKTLAGAVNGCVGAEIRSLDMELPAGALVPLLAALAGMRENVDELLKDLRNAEKT
jgi:hypothetical protein